MSETQPQYTLTQETEEEGASKAGGGAITLGLICLVVALLAFGLGTLERSRVNNYDANEIYCGDDLMSPGDTCLDFSGEGGGDYAEMREQHEANHETSQNIARVSMLVAPVALVPAVLLLGLGLVKRMSARRRSAAGR
ncbi:MAG TPA: hypothetical protein VK891_18240 [Euzebyales bacterium]|nr:hypothetical protein [Euzebyales bacterium]